jgi:hypothetical protein
MYVYTNRDYKWLAKLLCTLLNFVLGYNLVFQYFEYERTSCRPFQTQVVCPKWDIYVFNNNISCLFQQLYVRGFDVLLVICACSLWPGLQHALTIRITWRVCSMISENHSGHATKVLFSEHVRHLAMLAILLMPFDFPTPNTFK